MENETIKDIPEPDHTESLGLIYCGFSVLYLTQNAELHIHQDHI